jgi:predicted transcriptional regulator
MNTKTIVSMMAIVATTVLLTSAFINSARAQDIIEDALSHGLNAKNQGQCKHQINEFGSQHGIDTKNKQTKGTIKDFCAGTSK